MIDTSNLSDADFVSYCLGPKNEQNFPVPAGSLALKMWSLIEERYLSAGSPSDFVLTPNERAEIVFANSWHAPTFAVQLSKWRSFRGLARARAPNGTRTIPAERSATSLDDIEIQEI